MRTCVDTSYRMYGDTYARDCYSESEGGIGKTTLSGHLAVGAVRAKNGSVVLIDTDPQGSLSQWWHERKAETPHLAQIEPAKLKAQLATLEENGIDIAVVDTPPAVTATNRQVIALASLVLVSTRPSPHDLRAVGSTIGMAEEAKKKMILLSMERHSAHASLVKLRSLFLSTEQSPR